MIFFSKIKSELDKKISEDENKENLFNEKFSPFGLVTGRILITKSFFRVFSLIFFLWILSIYYIKNRYDCEALIKHKTELNKQLEEVNSIKLITIEKLLKNSTRSAISEKLRTLEINVPDERKIKDSRSQFIKID